MRTVALVLSSLAPLLAQDLVVVSWNGDISRVDAATGVITTVASGFYGLNGLALDRDGCYWSSTNNPPNFQLVRIDPTTLTATAGPACGDFRGLAATGNSRLWAIEQIGDMSSIDALVMIDTFTGQQTRIGATGRTGLQSLALHAGELWAMDIHLGLMRLDPATGVATVAFPNVRGNIQGLCAMPNGDLIGFESDRFVRVDTQIGVISQIGPTVGFLDVRGLEVAVGSATPFGQGCTAAVGVATLTAGGVLAAPGQLLTTSTGHYANRPALLLLGLDDASWNGTALPLSVDSWLGTNGCSLLVSPDAIVAGLTSTSTPGPLQFGIQLGTNAAGLQLFAQHVALERPEPRTSWSNGVRVQIR
ncbi:MAG: hypothetical protein IPK26_28610 [Planctomycetes bacterium]|nr:hypothetical protein [Planctomycetota bacterium]